MCVCVCAYAPCVCVCCQTEVVHVFTTDEDATPRRHLMRLQRGEHGLTYVWMDPDELNCGCNSTT